MWKALLIIAAASISDAALPCNSVLRKDRPDLFTQCSCLYGSWSSWSRTSGVISSTNCASGYHYNAQRSRKDNNGNCKDETQTKSYCEATLEEKAKIMITALGLKARVAGKSSAYSAYSNTLFNHKRRKSICSLSSGQICKQGRRSIPFKEEVNEPATIEENNDNDIVDNVNTPEMFNLEEYLTNVKTHRNKRQSSGKERFVLFMLDTSGSIGARNFNKVTSAIADLVTLLCNAKVAVMTYSTDVYREFCYDCYQGSIITLRNTIKNIKYRGGLRATGDAIRCACDYMLNSPCGFSRNIYNPPIVDVIFITDGHSNTGEDVCTATKCLDSIANVSVFPIALGYNINWKEFKCIRGNNGNPNDILNIKDINALLNLIRTSISKLHHNPSYCIN
ncbi:uncharacterized protein [Dysidea avara]|uniref:uncharacterized protein n=1 Tax=Dysidea avara TaxID=196820 RepID=UPI00332C9FF2